MLGCSEKFLKKNDLKKKTTFVKIKKFKWKTRTTNKPMI
jgi:hypothetical protein